MHDKNTKLSNDEQITKSVSGIQFLNTCYTMLHHLHWNLSKLFVFWRKNLVNCWKKT